MKATTEGFKTMMRRYNLISQLRTVKADFIAQQNPAAVVLMAIKPDYKTRRRGAVIHPSPRNPGEYQVSYFDDWGFSYHTTEKTYTEAIKEALKNGYEKIDFQTLEELSEEKRFIAGNIVTSLPSEIRFKTTIQSVIDTL